MRLMNSFRAVNEATKVVLNYHKMGKKDPMNKVYSNIFSVMAKESRKLENQLEVDEVNLRMKIRAENAKIMKKSKAYEYDMNKELAGTSEGSTFLFIFSWTQTGQDWGRRKMSQVAKKTLKNDQQTVNQCYYDLMISKKKNSVVWRIILYWIYWFENQFKLNSTWANLTIMLTPATTKNLKVHCKGKHKNCLPNGNKYTE